MSTEATKRNRSRENEHAKRRSNRKKREQERKLMLITMPFGSYGVLLSWLYTEYGITEMEFLFGSQDCLKIKRIEVVRAYLASRHEKGMEPSISEAREEIRRIALNAYFRVYPQIRKGRKHAKYVPNMSFLKCKLCSSNH